MRGGMRRAVAAAEACWPGDGARWFPTEAEYRWGADVSIAKTVGKLAGCSALGGVLLAGMIFPLAGGVGYVSNRASDTVDNSAAEVVDGVAPGVTTMTDVAGNPIAWLYEQRRFEVRSDQISNEMKLAIVSIEDKRFPEHRGWTGRARCAHS
ncbi:hypothetical protein GCM10020255_009330 [Rhodococcus baikonurensis]